MSLALNLDAPTRESRSGTARVNGLDMHYFEQGSGPPIVLLHGFPDHAGTWRSLADRLASSFRVIAPDQRGYGRTSRPSSVDDYRLDTLVADIGNFLDALGIPRVYLCGHDWGGVLAFAFAARHPHRVVGLIALNAAPHDVLQHMIWHDPDQQSASQYIRFLRSSEADTVFNEANVDVLLDRFLGSARRSNLLTDADMSAYHAAWTHVGVWQAMLAWYRAAPFDIPDPAAHVRLTGRAQFTPIDAPVLLLWGDRDTAFVPAMADAVMSVCHDGTLERLPDAGHVPHRDDPDRCAQLIAAFAKRHPFPS